ncbi:MAG: hypothetical protein R2771_03915 [Saprospiraceae bacterium]
MKCFKFSQKWKKYRIPEVSKNENKIYQLFLIFFILFLSSSKFSAQSITLGDDIAICQGQKLYMADLDPVVTGISGAVLWSTSGDGAFSPTYTYPSATYYTPGSADIANGFFYLTLQGYNNESVSSDQVKVFIQDDELFACNDNVIFPLNLNCEFQVTVPMLLEGENEDEPYNLYDISIYDSQGEVISGSILTGEYIGQTLNYTVTHECGWNAYSGTITVKDNYHPVTAS